MLVWVWPLSLSLGGFCLARYFLIFKLFKLLFCVILSLVLFLQLIWFLRFSIPLFLLVDFCSVQEGTLVGVSPQWCVYELDVVIPAFWEESVILVECLLCLVFSYNEHLNWWCLCKISWSLLELLLPFDLSLIEFYVLNSWIFWISIAVTGVC